MPRTLLVGLGKALLTLTLTLIPVTVAAAPTAAPSTS
jgi:hypothetical protein